MTQKDRFLFEKIIVSAPTFSADPDLTLNLIDNQSLLFVNEGSGSVDVSFDGFTIHGEINSAIGTGSLTIPNFPFKNIWFKVHSGGSSTILVQNNANVYSNNNTSVSIVAADGYELSVPFADPFPVSGLPVGFHDGSEMQSARVYDIDSGIGTEFVLGTVLRASAPGGSVEVGTESNPLRVEPSGNTPQPVTDNGGSLTVDSPQLPSSLVGGRLDSNIGSWLGSTLPTVGQKAMTSSIPVVIASDQSKVLIGGVNGGGTTQAASVFDVDSGAGTQFVLGAVLRTSSSGGSVEAGTSINPLRTDPTGTTAQPVTDNGGSITVDSTQLPAALVGGRLDNNVGSWLGSTAPTVGQKAMTASVPVVIASDQSKVLIGGVNGGGTTQAATVFDADTGAGTQYILGTVLRASSSGGSVETGTSTNPLRIDPTGTTKQPVVLFDANGSSIKGTLSQELKVSQLYTFADLTNKYELDYRFWDTKTSTGGTTTHIPSESAIRASVTGASGSTAEIVTNSYYKYQSGYTQLIDMSIINSDNGQANQIREWGYFDTDDGVFFRLSGTTFYIVERTSTSGVPTETTYAQSVWNIDPLDGTGPSGITLDLSKGNIFQIEIQWFGVGSVRYSIDGILVHEVAHANTLSSPYLKTATLPVQFRVTNTGASSAGSLTMICCRVAAQGQIHDPFEWVYSTISPADKLVGLTEVPILSIQPKATYNSITNRMWILPKQCTISTEGYKLSFKVLYNATLTGASWTSADVKSGTNYDTSATSYSGGELIYRGFMPLDTDYTSVDLTKFFDIFGRILRNAGYNGSGTNVADSLTIVAACEAVGTTKVRANMTWAEIR